MHGRKQRMKKGVQKVGKCSTVMFVQKTRGGILVRKLRERERERLS